MQRHIYETKLFVKLNYISINEIVRQNKRKPKDERNMTGNIHIITWNFAVNICYTQKYDDPYLCVRFALINQFK